MSKEEMEKIRQRGTVKSLLVHTS